MNAAETRSAVVELSHPWKNVTILRKLPPLKYYYDLEMGESEGNTTREWVLLHPLCILRRAQIFMPHRH